LFDSHRIWLDEDARVGSILAASMEEHLVVDIVDLNYAH
jgi:hypothetical protein